MRNAREEFETKVMTNGTVKCAVIRCRNVQAVLKPGYTEQEFKEFLSVLKTLDYNNGYGGQELYGVVWMTDGTWCDRGEYDGSEWWEHHRCPEIPVDWEDTRCLAKVVKDHDYLYGVCEGDDDEEEDVE